MITYLLDTLVNSIKTSLINKLGLDPSTEVDLDDFPQLIDDIPILDSVEELTVTENGTYTGTDGVTYNPVNVNLPLGSKSVTANGTYTASDDSLQGYSSVTVDIDDTDLYRDTTDSTYESVKTLSNCGAFPMLSLTAEINAVQDLHGYDHPWAGGAGKNLIPMTVADVKSANTGGTWSGNSYVYGGITYTIQTDSGGNVIGINADGTSTSAYAPFYLSSQMNVEFGKEYIINGSPQSPSPSTWRLWTESSTAFPSRNRLSDDIVGNNRRTAMANETVSVYIQIFTGQILSNKMFYPMIRLASETDATFAPYTNICPISGRTEVVITQKDNLTNPTVTKTYTIQLGDTVYGAHLDVTRGKMTVDRGYIASYNGETLPSTWISDRDVYAEGTTPTIGAEVVYELATPITYQLTPTQVKLLLGTNNIWANSGDVGDARYFRKVEL